MSKAKIQERDQETIANTMTRIMAGSTLAIIPWVDRWNAMLKARCEQEKKEVIVICL
jgi:hypothetical protein